MKHKKSGSPKKKTRGPRIALHLPVQAQGLHTRCVAIWTAIKADTAHFASPYPPAATVDGDLAALSTALQAAEGGDPVAITALGGAEAKVRQTFGLLGKYVESAVRAGPVEEAPDLIANVLMFESKVGKRAPKPELEVRHGAASGAVVLVALAVASAVAYFWELSLDQQAWTPALQTGQARCSLAGLTPGKTYYFRFRALKRSGGLTDPSQIVSFIVT